MRVPGWVVAVAAASIAAGCGSGSGDETTIDDGRSPPPPEVDGTSWRLVAGDGPLGSIELVDGYLITITFEGNQLSGTAACNGYGGTYRLDGNTLVVSELSWTEMACERVEVMAAEQAYLAALLDVTEVTATGEELVLGSSATELVFAQQAEIPRAELLGSTWVLETLVQDETALSVSGDQATLQLNADGTFVGSTGCRALTGDYRVSGASVQFTSLQADGDCPPDLRAQDNLVVTVLGDGFGVEIDGSRLTLTSMGDEGLVYRAE
jgi:heat shock protein HslJ